MSSITETPLAASRVAAARAALEAASLARATLERVREASRTTPASRRSETVVACTREAWSEASPSRASSLASEASTRAKEASSRASEVAALACEAALRAREAASRARVAGERAAEALAARNSVCLNEAVVRRSRADVASRLQALSEERVAVAAERPRLAGAAAAPALAAPVVATPPATVAAPVAAAAPAALAPAAQPRGLVVELPPVAGSDDSQRPSRAKHSVVWRAKTERRRGRGALSRTIKRVAAAAAIQAFVLPAAFGNPTGGKVVGGNATIQHTGNTTTIDQHSNQAFINWRNFNISANELVKFVQPSSSAVAVNRVTDGNPTTILGHLQANGRVFIVNPNGVVFGAGSQVDVNGLLATTFDLSDKSLASGKVHLEQRADVAPSFVINKGEIKIADNGFCFLVAPTVDNEKLIVAQLGTVVLASGKSCTVDFNGDGLIKYELSGKVLESVHGPDGKPLSASVANKGTIVAPGGQVALVGNASRQAFPSVVNNSGIIEAQSLTMKGGKIVLSGGDEGIVQNTGRLSVAAAQDGAKAGSVTIQGQLAGNFGTIDARGQGSGSGGNVTITSTAQTLDAAGSKIDVSGGARGSAGTVLLDSEKHTTLAGEIDARGGALGGNGGNVHASSGGELDLTGHVDALAPEGKVGTLLLDPKNIDVNDATGVPYASGTNNQFSNNPAGNTAITASSIDGQTANVVLQANNDITVTSPIAMTNPGVGITLQAGRSVVVNNNIATNNGAVTISANDAGATLADRDPGAGNITVASGRSINAGTGAVTLSIGALAGGNPGAITVDSVTGGAVQMTSAGSITQSGAGTINAATSLATTVTGSGAIGPLTINTPSLTVSNPNGTATFTAPSGNVDVSSANAQALTVNATAGNVSFDKVAATGGVTLNAPAGAITQDSAGSTLSAASATLLSANGVGTTGLPIATSVGQLTASATAANAPIEISQSGALASVGITTNAGDVHVTPKTGSSTLTYAGSPLELNASSIGAITFKDTGGNVKVGNVNAGASGAVSITAQAGINPDTSVGTNVTAGSVTLAAGTNIAAGPSPLETAVGSMNATALAGGIFVANQGALALGSLAAVGNTVTINATGAITDASGGTKTNVTGANVNLTGASIGTAADNVSTSAVTVNLAATAGDVNVNTGSGTTNLSSVTASGNATLTASGTNGALVAAGPITGGTIALTAPGPITQTAGTITASNSLAFDVTGTGNGIGNGGAPVQIQTPSLTVTTNGGHAVFSNGGSGNIDLAGINLGGQQPNSTFLLTTAGPSITDSSGKTVSANTINLTTNGLGAGGIGTPSNPIVTSIAALSATTQNGGIYVANSVAGTSFLVNNVAAQQVPSGGSAGAGPVLDANGNVVVMGPNGSQAGTSNVVISSNDDVVLNKLAATGSATLTTSNGRIFSLGNGIVNATATSLTLDATGQIGGNGQQFAIMTAVNGLDAATTNGSIYLGLGTQTTVGTITAGGAGSEVQLSSALPTGSITLGTVTAPGNVTITATNASILGSPGNLITANAAILTAANGIGAVGNPVATAVQNLTTTTTGAGAPTEISQAGALASVNVTTNHGEVEVLPASGTATLTYPSSTFELSSSNIGSVTFNDNGGSLEVGNVNAGPSGTVSITALAAITADPAIPTNVTAQSATLVATNSIGTAGAPLSTALASVNASTTANGSIFITNAGALTATATATGPGNQVTLSTTGDLTVGKVTAAGAVHLTSTTGAIQETGTTALIQGASATLNAATQIGSSATPLATQLGTLTANASNGGITLANAGNLTVTSTSATGNVTLADVGNLTLGSANAGGISAPGNTVAIDATGKVLDGSAGAHTDVTANTLTAVGSSIGGPANPITTSAGVLNLVSRGGPIAAADNVPSVVLTAASEGQNAQILVTNTGSILVNTVAAPGNEVTLVSQNGAISDNTGGTATNVSANLLAASAPGGVNLNVAVNQFAGNGGAAGVSIFDSLPLQLSDAPVTAQVTDYTQNPAVTTTQTVAQGISGGGTFSAPSITVLQFSTGKSSTMSLSGNLSLSATQGNVVFLDPTSTINANGHAINVSATDGASGTTACVLLDNITNAGNVTVNADLHIGIMNISAPGANVVLNAQHGIILQNPGTQITAQTAKLYAATPSAIDLQNHVVQTIADNSAAKALVAADNTTVNSWKAAKSVSDADVQQWTQTVSTDQTTANTLDAKAKTADQIFNALLFTADALDIVSKIAGLIKIPAKTASAAAQAIPLTGDAGAKTASNIFETISDIADRAAAAAHVIADIYAATTQLPADGAAAAADAQLGADTSVLAHSQNMNNAFAQALQSSQSDLQVATVQQQAGALLQTQALQAQALANAIGTKSQPIVLQVPGRVDATGVNSHVYLNTLGNTQLGTIAASNATNSAQIVISGTGDLQLIGTLSAQHTVNLSTPGAITNGGGLVQAPRFVANATNGIGFSGAGAILTNVDQFAGASSSGGVAITNQKKLEVATVGGLTGVVSGANGVELHAAGDLVLSAPIQAPGQSALLFANGGAIIDNNVGATSVTAQNLSLVATNGVGTTQAPLNTQVSNLTAQGGSGGLHVTNTGDLTLQSFAPNANGVGPTANVSATGGAVEIATTGNLQIAGGFVQAEGLPVTLTATGGSITEASSAGTPDVTGSTVTLVATGGGIGTSGAPLQVDSDTLSADASRANGNIFITDPGQDGDGINVRRIAAGAGDVTLVAQNASITQADALTTAHLLGNNVNLTTTGAGTIGTAGQTLFIDGTTLNATTNGGGTFIHDTGVDGNGLVIGTVATSGGNVAITTDGSLVLGHVDAGAGAVSLTANGASIVQSDAGTDAHVVGSTISLAVNGLSSTIGTSSQAVFLDPASRLDAMTSGGVGNDIFVTGTGALPLGLVAAGRGNVTLGTLNGSITQADTASNAHVIGATVNLNVQGAGSTIGTSGQPLNVDATKLNAQTPGAVGNDIVMTDTGESDSDGLQLGLVNAGLANVTLATLKGSITQADNSTAAHVVGATINLSVQGAASTIGTKSQALNLDATTLNASTAGAVGNDIFLTDTGVADNDGLQLGFVTAGQGNVTLNTLAGSMTQTGTAPSIVGSTVNLGVLGGQSTIGTSGQALETVANALNASTQGFVGDDIFLANAGAVQVGLVTAGKGNVTLAANGSITQADALSTAHVVGATVNLNAQGSGTIGTKSQALNLDATTLNASTAGGVGNDIVIADTGAFDNDGLKIGLVTAGAGDVTLDTRNGSITQADNATTAHVVGATVTLGAQGAASTIGTSGQALYLNATKTLDASTDGAAGNDIFITGTGAIPVGLVNAGNGNVTLTALNGSITQADATTLAHIIGDRISLTVGSTAASTIGTSSQSLFIDTTILFATTAGGQVFVQDAGTDGNDGFTIGGMNTAGGNISLTSQGNLILGHFNAGSGTVTLTALNGSILQGDSGTDPHVVGSIINLDATGAGSTIGTANQAVFLDATTKLNAMTDGAVGNDIFITSTAAAPVGLVSAGLGNVTLATLNGSITQADALPTAHVVGGTLNLSVLGAGSTIGTLGQTLNIDATKLNASTPGAVGNDIFVTDTNALHTDGLQVGLVNAGRGNVTLDTRNGSITQADGLATAHVVGATVNLNAQGAASTIGTKTQTLNVDATTLNATTAGAAGNDIFLGDTGNDGNGLAIGLVNAGLGNVTLDTANGSITQVGGAAAAVIGATVNLNARGVTSTIGTSGQAFNLDATTLDATTSGNVGNDIFLTDTGKFDNDGLALGLVNAGLGNVTLNTRNGSLTEVGGTAAAVIGATVNLNVQGASSTIGTSGQTLNLDATTLNATTAGGVGNDIFLTDTGKFDGDGLAIGLVTAGRGNVTLNTLNGSLTQADSSSAAHVVGATINLDVQGGSSTIGTSGQTLDLDATTLNAKTAGKVGNDIFMTDTGVDGDGLAIGSVNAGAGNVTLVAKAGNVTAAGGASGTQITASSVSLTTNGSGSTIGASGSPLVLSVSTIDALTNNGNIFLTNNVAGATNVDRINAGTGAVTLTATGGSIVEAPSAPTPQIAGSTINLVDTFAGASIGTSPAAGLDVNAATVNVKTNGGPVFLDATGTTGLGVIDVGPTATFALVTDGSITEAAPFGTPHIIAGAVDLVVTGAGNTIGTSAQPLELSTSKIDATTNNGGIFLKNSVAGPTAIDQINAGTGNVALTVTNGSIVEATGAPTPQITGGTVNLVTTNAGSSIGTTANAIDVNAAVVNATTSNGGIFLDGTGDLAIGLANAGTASVGLFAPNGNIVEAGAAGTAHVVGSTVSLTTGGGTIGTAAQPFELQAGTLNAFTAGGNVNVVETAGDLAVGAINARTGTVSVSTLAGSILEGAGGLVTASQVTLTTAGAGTTIGSATPVQLDTPLLAATTVAGVNLTDSASNVAVQSITTGGNVSLSAVGGGSIVESGAPGTARIVATGTVNLATNGSGSIGTKAQPLELSAADLNAQTSGSGIYVVQTGGNLGVGVVSALGGDVSLSANGSLLDAGQGAANVTGGHVTLTSSTAGATLGTGPDPLKIVAATLDATTSNGAIWLVQVAGGVGIDVVNAGTAAVSLQVLHGSMTAAAPAGTTNVVGGTVTLSSTGGAIGTASQALQVNAPALNASTDGGNIYLDDVAPSGVAVGRIAARTGLVHLTTTGSVTDAGTDPTAAIQAQTLELSTSSASAFGTPSAALRLDAANLWATTSGGSAWLTDVSPKGVAIGMINLGAGKLTLTATKGAITETSSTTPPLSVAGSATVLATPHVIASQATLVAQTGIGPLDTQIGELDAQTVTGGVSLSNAGSLTIGGTSQTVQGVSATTGPISIRSSGALTANNPIVTTLGDVTLGAQGNVSLSANVTGGNVSVSSTTGSITLGATIKGQTSVTLDAPGTITLGVIETPPGATVNLTGSRITTTESGPNILGGIVRISSDTDAGNLFGLFATSQPGEPTAVISDGAIVGGSANAAIVGAESAFDPTVGTSAGRNSKRSALGPVPPAFSWWKGRVSGEASAIDNTQAVPRLTSGEGR